MWLTVFTLLKNKHCIRSSRHGGNKRPYISRSIQQLVCVVLEGIVSKKLDPHETDDTISSGFINQVLDHRLNHLSTFSLA